MKRVLKFVKQIITNAGILGAVVIVLTGCAHKERECTNGDRQIVVLAGINMDDHIRQQAEVFNQNQEIYQIEIKDYAVYENPRERLDFDIISGEVPDVLDMSYLDHDKYISKHLLCDLNMFMEQDVEFNRSLFFENVIQAMEVDGKLYYMMPFFTVGGLMGRSEDIRNGLSLSEMQEQESKYGADARAFYASNESVLRLLVESNYQDFIDWERGISLFDSDDFIEFLRYANTYPDVKSVMADESSKAKKIQAHKILYHNLYGFADVSSIVVYKEIMGGNIDFMGYPSLKKCGMTVQSALASHSFGITEGSDAKEGSWEFLKQLMSREYCVAQMEEYFTDGFPLRKDVFEDVIRKYTATEEYTDEYGHLISPVDGSVWIDGIEMETEPLKEEDISYIRKMIACIDHSGGNVSTSIMDIINEETALYFAGERDIDKTAETIQNRVSIYMSEQE